MGADYAPPKRNELVANSDSYYAAPTGLINS